MNKQHLKIFTLVELLVVISVISILMTILLPALKKAKSKGQSIVCISNLKQCGTGVIMYTADFNGIAPSNFDLGEHPGRYWVDQLGAAGIMESSIKQAIPTGNWAYSGASNLGTSSPFCCTILPPLKTYTASGITFTNSYCSETTYGMRSSRSTYCATGEKHDSTGHLPIYQSLRTDTPYLADSIKITADGPTQSFNASLNSADSSKIYFAHGNTTNCWFPDGKAISWTASDLSQIKDYSGNPATGQPQL